MTRAGFAIALLLLSAAATVSAQERAAGAGRVEVSAFPGGGTFFTKGPNTLEPSFKNYALGASGTYNLSNWIGVEGEIGGGIGFKQSLDFNQTAMQNIKGPNTLAYNGNVVYSPIGMNRILVPYATGGLGGLTLFSRNELEPLGLAANTTLFTGNVGGGVKWFSDRHWGVRGDYRFFMVNGKDSSQPFFGLTDTRYGHRVYGSLLYTFGR